MKTSLFLTDPEAKLYAEGRVSMIVRPVKPQPKDDVEAYFGTLTKPSIHKRCPYTIGQTIFLKESWDSIELSVYYDYCGSEEVCLYKADGVMPNDGWNSPATMPSWAVRHKPVLESVEVKRVKELTDEEYKRTGSEPCTWRDGPTQRVLMVEHKTNFKFYWNQRYSKTEYAWDKNPFVFIYQLSKN